ncbi:MAG: class I SAM-dependent methyltransferase, partial [Elusimicrobia bacterium]|nr:class I SAM-dependent methyltransferase [Elusimicrobiota bacterium]
MKNIRCKICSSETITVTALSALYYKCINCGYVFKNISSKPGKKETKERYLPHENTSDNSGYVEMFNNFLEKAVFPFSGPPGQVLDFGCGYGPVLSEILSQSGYTTDIYDKYFFRKKPWPEDMPKFNII